MKWFKHDSNAHTDDKIQKVLMRYGADGYALYWYCIELIASRVSPDNITFELKHDAEILGYHLKIDTLRVEEIMKYLVSLGLFNYSNEKIVCYKLAKRLDNTMTQNREIKETLRNFKKLPPEEKRLEEITLRKEGKPSRFLPPSVKEVSEYVKEKGYSVDANNFINFYESKGWMVGKNKMKDWKAAIRTWAQRNKTETKEFKEFE